MDEPRITPVDGATPDSGMHTLIAQALESYASGGREAFERLCAEHPEAALRLRRRLASLERLGWIAAHEEGARAAPARIGRYRVVRELGRGGMGVVFLAVDERLERRVAIKTLSNPVFADPRRRERFVREVRAVAQLRHPGIIPLYEFDDASEVTYFAMEFVEGATLAEALASLQAARRPAAELTALDLWRALFPEQSPAPADWGRSYSETVARLTMEVAAALDHAHQQGIVHRDVKPSNVLVGRDGHARLFDFGLAQRGVDDALTRTGEIVGTFLYVAPEQVSGEIEIDGRADVYSLGATLYELATLEPPFQAATTQQLLRLIATRDARPARAVNTQLSADLETVAATALEKDPRRRYASAAALADDLRRVLELRPILARPAGRWTRTVRFARRNPAAAAALALAATLALVLPTGLLVANHYLRRERDNSEALLQFFVKSFELADADERGPDVPAREMLESSARRLARTPEVIPDEVARARLMRTLGSMFWMMGKYDDAEGLLTSALAIQRRALGPRADETAMTLNFLANLRRDQGRMSEAEPLYREALAAFDASEGERSEASLMLRGNLSTLLSLLGKHAQAQELGRRVVALVDEEPDRSWNDPKLRAESYAALAQVLERADALDEAEHTYARALELMGDGEGFAVTRAGMLYGLGRLEFSRGRFAQAEDYLTRALDDYLAKLGPDALSTLITLRLIGEIQYRQGAVDEAQVTLACAHEALTRVAGDRHFETALAELLLGSTLMSTDAARALSLVSSSALALSELGDDAPPLETATAWFFTGDLLLGQRRYAEAAAALERSVAGFRGPGIPAISRYTDALTNLGVARVHLGDVALGEGCLIEARDVLTAMPGDYRAAWLASDAALGECYASSGRYEQAEALLLGAIERARRQSNSTAVLRGSIERIVDLYQRWGRPELAARWRAELDGLAR